MAGIEVVGLVLGGFPLLISAAEHYRDGFEPLKKWKRFRRDFIKFIDLVDIERQLFHQVLQRLLLSAGAPYFKLELFMDPEYEGWCDEELRMSLDRRLGPSLPAYLSIISTMNRLMLELQTLLSLKNGKVDWASKGADRWDYQLKRIRLSFSDKGTSILESFETHNRKLRELLDSKDKLDDAKMTSKGLPYQAVFKEMRLYADSLYGAVYRAWKCNYEHSHQTAFRLSQPGKSTWPSTFEISFTIRKEAPKCLYINRDVIIYIRRDGKSQCSSEDRPRSAEFSKAHFLQTLREDFTSQPSGTYGPSSTDVEPSTLPPPSLLKVPYSPSSVSSSLTGFFSRRSPSISTSSQSMPASIFSSRGSDFKDDSSATNVSSSTSSSTLTKRSDSVKHKRRWSSFRRITKKSNKMYLSPSTNIERSHPLSAPLRPPSEFSHGTCTQIDDLCTCLCDPQSSSACIGHLNWEQKSYELRPAVYEQHAAPKESPPGTLSLEALLRRHKRDYLFSRRERYSIASIITTSLLQLQNSPWLVNTLGKNNIVFPTYEKHNSDLLSKRLYINNTFSSLKDIATSRDATHEIQSTAQQHRANTRNTLFKLGVLLLELLFSQCIEDQTYLRTQYLTAGQPHSGTDFLTARDWLDEAEGEDPDLAPIITCCVLGTFASKPDWTNEKFVQEVYKNIVAPLATISERWESAAKRT